MVDFRDDGFEGFLARWWLNLPNPSENFRQIGNPETPSLGGDK